MTGVSGVNNIVRRRVVVGVGNYLALGKHVGNIGARFWDCVDSSRSELHPELVSHCTEVLEKRLMIPKLHSAFD